MKLITAVAQAKKQMQPEAYSTVRAYMTAHYPATMRALQAVDAAGFIPRQPKGYNLVKRENKRLGFVYYVRYRHGGKMLSSKWNTRTNDRAEAERFARENREQLVGAILKSTGARITHRLKNFLSVDLNTLWAKKNAAGRWLRAGEGGIAQQ